jgi:hypothetical protein
MSKDTDSLVVVVRGTARTIEYAVCSNGTMPAREFIEGLDPSDQRKLDTLFRRMAETGKIFNREQFKLVEGEIFEFKRFQTRVGCFQVGPRWILTHGFQKKGDRWPKAEVIRAERIMREHLERERRK